MERAINEIVIYYRRFNIWFFEIDETPHITRSRFHRYIAKLPLLLAMYVSSVLVAISTYDTFPANINEALRLSAAIIGGAAFDIILTTTVFSARKNKFSYLTIIAAFGTGLAIALDLYLQLNQEWLHALYIGLSTVFALHLATTSGMNVKELEAELYKLRSQNEQLKETNKKLREEKKTPRKSTKVKSSS